MHTRDTSSWRYPLRGKLGVVCALALLAGLVCACSYWVRAQWRQYALDRQLIAALENDDEEKALALVNAGADPTTRERPGRTALTDLVDQLLHHAPSGYGPSAVSIACGAISGSDDGTFGVYCKGPDCPALVQAMLAHGAEVNGQTGGWTLLMGAVCSNRPATARLLIKQGANVNTQLYDFRTGLPFILEMWRNENGCTFAEPPVHFAPRNHVLLHEVSPLTLAHALQHPDIEALLKRSEATVQ